MWLLSAFSWSHKDQIYSHPERTLVLQTLPVCLIIGRETILPLDLMSISEPRGAVKSKPEWNNSPLVPHSHRSHHLLHHPYHSEPQRSLQLDPKRLPWRIRPHLSPSWMTSKEVERWTSACSQARGSREAHRVHTALQTFHQSSWL